ncbi:error-prone DNA polymerase [Vibrio sp. B1Z05]|uniref:error-prone DNA polymerase n=1 Tax=Vibrio sp. B1Z05 TaxID=2654980 RepID=UPI00128C44DC|nr:error-prone DNA polymerase [Vibrio sp. B1Z05]MPW37161.1 DNA polymerase III subunit alpha [Vibrio sp. B1Z05]
MSTVKYAELFCQSNFSFLTGASHPEELITQADFLGYSALAITDECSLAGVVRAHTTIKNKQLNIKLIVGSMFWLDQKCQIVLLCPNQQAYAELARIITNARRRSDKGKYSLSQWDVLSIKHCFIIWVPQMKEYDHQWAKWLTKQHSARVWLGLQRHLTNTDKQYLQYNQKLAHQYAIPITACGGVLMHNATRLPLQHTLVAIKHNSTVTSISEHLLTNAERTLRNKPKLSKLFRKEWLEEAHNIASRCCFNLASLGYQYPAEIVPDSVTPFAHLCHLVNQGKQLRFPHGVPENVQITIDKELKLIDELNYAHFFLTIHDVVMFAKQKKILYQGRGSAANSVVCYCLEITSVDPRQISVLFERFISKERNEPPDIDVDFEHHRREEVIQYIYQKYGRERAALAATVISYRLKSAIREVGKALAIDETQLDFFIKNINRRDVGLNWQAQIYELGLKPDSLKGQLFIQLVDEIIGFPRHLSQHVGGFVISAGPLYELVPVENAAMPERTIIQWDKDDLESLGLLKVDVLALGMLSAIRRCFQLIERHHQRQLSIADITRLQDDPNVYAMLQKADTIGVFQIESRAQMSMLPRLKPRCYYDLVIQIAIVRPGPIQGDMIHPYLKRRNGEQAISYPSKEVESVLSRTLGVPIFQEQVIKLAMVAAGFSGGEADQLRRAMAAWKKNGDLFKFRDKLISGMLCRGYEQSFAEQIFAQICGFGEYGFPESHSASFAVLAYCSAWLKCYYPAEFYTALLNSQPMGFYSSNQLLQDAKRHGVNVHPISINQSNDEHSIVRNNNISSIQLGLKLIKGLSQNSREQLLAARPSKGFTHIQQIKNIGINRQQLHALTSANALYALTGDRYSTRWQLMDSVEDLPLFNQPSFNRRQDESIKHGYTFQTNDYEALIEDYSATGLSLNQHPITLLEKENKLGKFIRQNQLIHQPHQSMVTVVGVVTGRQSPHTAGGITFFTLEDDTGNINVVVWQATARAQKKSYLTAKILKVKGIIEKEGDVIHVIAGQLIDISDQLSQLASRSRDFH